MDPFEQTQTRLSMSSTSTSLILILIAFAFLCYIVWDIQRTLKNVLDEGFSYAKHLATEALNACDTAIHTVISTLGDGLDYAKTASGQLVTEVSSLPKVASDVVDPIRNTIQDSVESAASAITGKIEQNINIGNLTDSIIDGIEEYLNPF